MDLTKQFNAMAISLFVAYRCMLLNETPVACILYDEESDKVESIGCNDTNNSSNGTRHAEFLAIERILDRMSKEQIRDRMYVRSVFSKLTLYVTVEPCIMCASAIKQIGIKCVIFGCSNDRFGGNGTVLSIHSDNIGGNYSAYGGILRTEAIQLLRNFYIQENQSAPVPKIKKNRDLEMKQYPQNMKFERIMDKTTFISFYGSERFDEFFFGSENEITPTYNRGYKIRDLISVDYLANIAYLSEMYQGADFMSTLSKDLSTFYDFFYDIEDNGRVSFSKTILTIDNVNCSVGNVKKRKLSMSKEQDKGPQAIL